MQEPTIISGGSALADLLTEFRRVRTEEPQFYYNELAERARAIGRLRPVLENFLADRLSFGDFKSTVAGESRRELGASKGRETGRYWRFNASGRLFLESFYKAAERAGRLNATGRALQIALTVPASLDQAGQRFEAFDLFLGDLLTSGIPALSQGFVPYLMSYFWAVQRPEWPIYGREVRAELTRLGRLERESKGPRSSGSDYTRFYLAFTGLGNELGLSAWELESFLNWLGRRDFSPSRLLKVGSQISSRRGGLEKLRQALEPRLQTELAAGLRGLLSGQHRLLFQEAACPLRLELRLTPDAALAGASFDGFSTAALSSAAGSKVLDELQGFLTNRPEYRFYDHTFTPSDPVLPQLSAEFWLLRPLEKKGTRKTGGPDLLAALLADWRLLYPFARRLVAPFDDVPMPSALSYEPETEAETWVIAEESATYLLESAIESEGYIPDIGLTPNITPYSETTLGEVSNERAAQVALAETEVRRLDHLKPPPLTTEQIEGLLAFIQERLVIPAEKVRELLTHLEAGRNILLYGPPGSGKTRLARLLVGQLCSPDPGWTPENVANNYSLATAGPEWSTYDVIGGIRPGLAGTTGRESERLAYYFEPGVVARAALECERSLGRTGRPHYLLIDEFNRANQERAFGELFTVLEYRDLPLLLGARLGRLANLYLPDAFRIIGTMNSEDRNTLFELGLALRRRFALVEIDLPPPAEERRFLPKAVKSRLSAIALTPEGEFVDPDLRQALDKLTTFAAAVRPDPTNPQAGGKKLGTAPLIEALLFCAVAARFYRDPAEALEDAILADLLPQLERTPQAITRALTAVSPGGSLSDLTRVRATLQRMSGTSTFF